MMGESKATGWPRAMVLAVFAMVLGADLSIVAVAGTDIPFQDQWDVEGQRLLAPWLDGSLNIGDLFRPHNEHRIVWTQLLDLGLFSLNGQWDPLVQLVVCGVLRAALAAGLAGRLARGQSTSARSAITVGATAAFIPVAAWHNALWGFESQVLFCVGFSLVSLALLVSKERSVAHMVVGLAAGVAGLLAMAPAALVPVALLVIAGLRSVEARRWAWRESWPAAVLLVAALMLRSAAPAHAELQPVSAGEFWLAVGRALAWPHTGQPLAAWVMNIPLAMAIVARLARNQRFIAVDDFVMAIGIWTAGVAVAAAWTRGGSGEWASGVPSRYADFLVLLPLANAWCAVWLVRETAPKWRRSAVISVALWIVALFVGWLGLSAEMMRKVILPRARDVDAPVRLARAFQQTGDVGVFVGQPRLLVPHPNPEVVRTVLNDPRMKGVLPPSLQPERPMGPLSRGVRWLLWRKPGS